MLGRELWERDFSWNMHRQSCRRAPVPSSVLQISPQHVLDVGRSLNQVRGRPAFHDNHCYLATGDNRTICSRRQAIVFGGPSRLPIIQICTSSAVSHHACRALSIKILKRLRGTRRKSRVMLLLRQQWPLQQQSSRMFASNVAAKPSRPGVLRGALSKYHRDVQQSSRIKALLNALLFHASQPSAPPACPSEQAHHCEPCCEMLGAENSIRKCWLRIFQWSASSSL